MSSYARRNYTQLQAACTRKDKKLPVLHVRHTTEYSSILGKIVMQRLGIPPSKEIDVFREVHRLHTGISEY